MENSLKVEDQEISIKEYQGQRVVTLWNIANLHETTVKHMRMTFERTKKHMKEDVDYFLIEKEDEFVATICDQEKLNRNAINRSKNIPLFTESGYLMITKSLTDDRSWEVQRTLVNCYFKVKEEMQEQQEEEEVKESPKLQDLSEINKTIELMDSMFKRSRFSDGDKMTLVSSLLETAGVELPKIKIAEPVSKANYITLEELAMRIGVYREDKTPNVEATMFFATHVKTTLDDLRLTLRISEHGNCWFNIRFNPSLVDSVSKYLEEEKYPSVIDFKQVDGSIITIPIYYYQYPKNAI